MGGLKLQDLNWGMLNEISDSKQSQLTGDRRRTSTSHMLQQTATLAYSPDALGTRDEYRGFVVAYRETNYATYENPGSMLQEYVSLTNSTVPIGDDSDQETAGRYNNLAYKVYIPELNPQPAPRGANDPVLRSYPDIYSSMLTKEPIALGTLVVVKYESPALLRQPSIVRIVARDIIIENISDQEGQALGRQYSSGSPRALGAAADSKWGEKPNQRRMIDEAKRLKVIRQEIFEDTTDKWKAARGDLGPFSKKSNKKWTSNAILSLADQRALKVKFQSKIDQVARSLGMEAKTLEKIFKKESGLFDPYAINHDTSATGLIQFMPESAISARPGTASSLDTTVEKLLTMGPDKQLDYVEEYFKKNKRPSDNWEEVDWYFIVFYPKAIGKPPSYVIGTATTAAVNPGYADSNHPENLITRQSVKDKWMA